jgi:hypothetical protein
MNTKLRFAFEKETKGAVRYQEVGHARVLMWTLSISGPSIIPKLLLNMINAGSRLCA